MNATAAFTQTQRTAFPRNLLALPLPHLSVVLFCAAFLAYSVSPTGRLLEFAIPRGGEVVHVARSLAQTGQFADPFDTIPTGLTAHVAPAYPFLYSLILRAFGTGFAAAAVLWVLNQLLLAAHIALLPVLTQRLGLGARSGVLAALCAIVFTPIPVDPQWEAVATTLLLVVLFLWTLVVLKAPPSRSRILLLGILWGAGLLTNPILVLLLVAWPVAIWSFQSGSARRKTFHAAVLVIGAAFYVCVPLTVRNELVFGKLFFLRDNLGLELQTSNNPCAGPTLQDNVRSRCHHSTHPNRSDSEAQRVFLLGEYNYNQQKLKTAFAWIRQNPGTFATLTAQRFRYFWFPRIYSGWHTYPVWALTLLSLYGLWRMFWKNRLAAVLLASTLALYPLIYYVVQYEPRYRFPILWVTLVAGAFGLLELLGALGWFAPRVADPVTAA